MYVPAALGEPDADGDMGAMKVRVTVAPGAASVAPGLNAMPGISNEIVGPAGSAFVTLIVTVVVSAALSVTSSCCPGNVAVAVAQFPGVAGTANPQIGTSTPVVSVAVPGTAHRLITCKAADA